MNGSLDRLSLVRADLSITSKCNLNCAYCYAGSHDRFEELATHQWNEVFKKLRVSGAKKFIITGGEPFARRDMLYLLQCANDLGISITLLTNGTLIDEPLVRELARIERLCEIKVSLDSMTSGETHDYFRGAGTWNASLRAMHSLRQEGMRVVVNMTIHPLNFREIYSAAEECDKRGWLLEASPVVLEGRAERDHLLQTINLDEYQRNYRRALFAFPNTLRVDKSEITPEWELSFRCAMLFGTVGISPDGGLKPCLRSETFFRALDPVFCRTPSVLSLETIEIEHLEFFKINELVRSSFVPQPTECGDCEFLHGTCNGCVVAKSFMKNAGCCPKKEEIRNEEGA